jgi:hypothetical protein
MLVWQSGSFATVNIAEEIKAPQKKQTAKGLLKEKIKPQKNRQQFQIEGYVDSDYVRVIVDNVSKDEIITGQMFQENGEAIYVHGEFVDDVLHLYGPKGRHFTVIVPKD